MRIQEYIEEALQDIIEARTYISGNSISVRRRKQGQTLKGGQYVLVFADLEERPSINHSFYFATIEVSAITKIQEDLEGNNLDALWADVSDAITQDLTIVTLQAAIDAIDATSGIRIDGFIPQPGESAAPEQYYQNAQQFQIALKFTT
jgi:RNAse (barnase) inhibitor barstar